MPVMNEHETKAQKGPIRLTWDDNIPVLITPEDENRFMMESQGAISACQFQMAQRAFLDRFKEKLLPAVHEWCVSHQDQVRACYLTLTGQVMMGFVVSASRSYDFDLSDPVADLEFQLYQDNWPIEVIQIPNGDPDTVQTFFDPERSILVYGQPL